MNDFSNEWGERKETELMRFLGRGSSLQVDDFDFCKMENISLRVGRLRQENGDVGGGAITIYSQQYYMEEVVEYLQICQ